MGRIATLSALAIALGAPAFAETWSGTLLDNSCYIEKKTTSSCDATSATSTFALNVSGKIYTLDASGNSKAAAAFRDRANRPAGAMSDSAPVTAKVTGAMQGSGTLAVDSIELE